MSLIISLILAGLIHILPISLRLALDTHFELSFSAWTTILAVALVQAASLMLPGRKLRLLSLALLIPLSFSTLINLSSLVIFSSPVSLSGVVSVIQSNPDEVREFSEAYGTKSTTVLLLTFAVFGNLIYLFLRQPVISSWKPSGALFVLAMLIATPFFNRAAHDPRAAAWDLHEVLYSDRVFTSLIRYRGQVKAWNEERARWAQRGDVVKELKLETTDASKLAPVVVVVIGESTTRNHFGLYGYPRPTTPGLSAMKDDLIVFKDVVTPEAHTIPAVMGALCATKLRDGEITCSGATLLDIARAAGYKITWISNQTQIGFDDSSIVHLGRSADHSFFVNQDASSAGEADRNTSLDEKVMGPLEKTLAEQKASGDKQMIFVHLMGAHFTYEKRYPHGEKLFKEDASDHLSPLARDVDARALINHYDNAIAYQDKILTRIFKLIKTQTGDALGLYLSDHGEEVFDSIDFHGHSNDNLTHSMSEIPFVLATSDSYTRSHAGDMERIRQYTARPFLSSRLTPSLAQLLGLKYGSLDEEQCLFSKKFKPSPRMTSKGFYKAESNMQFGQR